MAVTPDEQNAYNLWLLFCAAIVDFLTGSDKLVGMVLCPTDILSNHMW